MLLASLLVSLAPCPQGPQHEAPKFAHPVRMKAGAEYVRVEAPGYAAPCIHDVDGDGNADLVVGQFADGKMRVFKGTKDGALQKGEWLQAEGDVAKVPGVW